MSTSPISSSTPVFRKIAEKIYSETPLIEKHRDLVLNNLKADNNYNKYYSISEKHKTIVPDVSKLPLMDAISILENLGLKVLVNGKGNRIRQSLKAGTKLKSGQKIILELSWKN